MATATLPRNGTLGSLGDTLGAITGSESTDELADLLLLAAELYVDASCRCESKQGPAAAACSRDVGAGRAALLDAYRDIIDKLRG